MIQVCIPWLSMGLQFQSLHILLLIHSALVLVLYSYSAPSPETGLLASLPPKHHDQAKFHAYKYL